MDDASTVELQMRRTAISDIHDQGCDRADRSSRR